MSQYTINVMRQNAYQSESKYGELLAKRKGISDGKLHRRQQGTIKQIDEWINACIKDVVEGRMNYTRGRKMIERWWKLHEKKRERLEHE